MAYQLLPNGGIQRKSDGACIPVAVGNRDYAAYLAWLAAGNVAQVANSRSLGQVKAEALEHVDKTAGAMRLPFISAIPGQEATYLKKQAEADRWTAAGSPPSPAVASYPYAAAECALTGATMAQTLANYRMQAAFMDGINVKIEAVRIHTKARIAAASTAGEVLALVAGAPWPDTN